MRIPNRLMAIHAATLLTVFLSVNAVAGQEPPYFNLDSEFPFLRSCEAWKTVGEL